jgi:hypothetical protein
VAAGLRPWHLHRCRLCLALNAKGRRHSRNLLWLAFLIACLLLSCSGFGNVAVTTRQRDVPLQEQQNQAAGIVLGEVCFVDDELFWRGTCEELGGVAQESIAMHPLSLDAHEVKQSICRVLDLFHRS